MSSLSEESSLDDHKVCIEFRNAGDAPRLKKNIFRVGRSTLVIELVKKLGALLQIPQDESLYVFVNTAFKPRLDEHVGDLYDCFQINDRLTIFYCSKEAWG